MSTLDRRQITEVVLFSAAYFVVAVIGLQFASLGGAASPFYPAAGIALAALFFVGPIWWPMISVASFLAFFATGTDHGLLGNTLLALNNGAVAGVVTLFMRRFRMRADLSRFADVVLLTFAAPLAAGLAAGIGVVILNMLAEISLRSSAEAWTAWFLGDLGGVLIALPLILTWRNLPDWRARRWLHFFVCIALTAMLSWMALAEHTTWRSWHVFPALVWAGLAFRARGVAAAMALIAVFALLGWIRGTGPFVAVQEFGSPMLFMQQFIAIAAVTMLMLSAVADERHGARDLAAARRRLGIIVDSAMDGIISVDRNGRIILFNPAAEKIFGCAAEEALGSPLDRFIPERTRLMAGEHLREPGSIRISTRKVDELGTMTGVRANGEQFPFEASISHVDAGDEQLSTIILRDVSKRVAAEQARDLLAREVDHRAKNALAVAQAIVALTKADTKQAYVEAVRGRISALARAHSLLAKGKWEGADIARLLEEELRPYGKTSQWSVSGPAAFLFANAVQPFGLVVHELATNACKYGALCASQGHVRVAWRWIENGQLEILWVESHGPTIAPPKALGFGSTLLREVVSRQLNGTITKDWRAEGLVARIVLPASAVRAISTDAPEPTGDLDTQAFASMPREGGAPRALIVEDEALVGLELADALRDAGWEVLGPVSSIETGLPLAEKAEVEVAVLDVNIHGEPIDPIADTLSKRGIPIVFCTGYQDFTASGYERAKVVRKPVRTEELINAVLGVSRHAA